jgi:hypothetical protein
MQAKHFFIATLTAALCMVAGMWALAYWLQPLHGDLTRIGGFAEREFGGNAPMAEFRPTLATFGSYEHAADVLVIGDSFANVWPHQQWQNWLALKTGWRIHTLDVHKVNLDTLLSSEIYRRSPPRIVIWNVVERDLVDEYARGSGTCEMRPPQSASRPLPIQPRGNPPTLASRPAYEGLNPGFVRTWAWHSFSRHILWRNTSDALIYPLSRGDLFTSKASDRLLVYRNDLRKSGWRSEDLARIRSGFADIADRVQANGITRLITAIAPDKSSIYRPWLISPSLLPESRMAALLASFPATDARLDQVLQRAVDSGTRDVYMPNDTHWNATGQKLVAEAILATLTAEGLAQ